MRVLTGVLISGVLVTAACSARPTGVENTQDDAVLRAAIACMVFREPQLDDHVSPADVVGDAIASSCAAPIAKVKRAEEQKLRLPLNEVDEMVDKNMRSTATQIVLSSRARRSAQ